MAKSCEQCERMIWYAMPNQKYCSDACKQKAYRRRIDPTTGSRKNRVEGARKAAITKDYTTKEVVCEQCGRTIVLSVRHTNQAYCGDACKQKAYRERKKAKEIT